MSDIEDTNVGGSIYDHPKVKELREKLTELTAKLDEFAAHKSTFDKQYNAVKESKEEYLKSVNTQLVGFDNEMRLFARQRDAIENEMYKVRSLKDSIQNGISETIEELAASKKAEEVQARWTRLLAETDFVWQSAIRQFQLECVRFMVGGFENELHGVLVADQMGLGKTLEATASMDIIQNLEEYTDILKDRCPSLNLDALEGNAVLWLCPTSIKEATVREIRKWSPERQTIKLEGTPEVRNNIVKLAHANGMVLLVGYEQLRDRKGKPVTPELFSHDWPIVILDEAHKFKSDTSSTFERVEDICKRAGFVVPMTGTPIMNRPQELWAILHMLTLKGKYSGKFKDKWRFENEYCSRWGNSTEFQYGAYDKLINNISDLVIRRRKDEVLEDMPDKVREVRFVELGKEQRDVYDQMRDKFLIWLDEQQSDFISASSILAQMTRLRQLALYPAGVKLLDIDGNEHIVDCSEGAKLDEAMDIIEELIDNGEKACVFSNYNEPLRVLSARIEEKYADQNVKTALIIGGQTDLSRANKVDRFNDPEDNLKVLLGNIAAMGLGLNLQGACSNAIFLDLGWNPGVNEQAEDRLHRQGQKNAVTIHIIQAEETIDAFIAQKIEDKQNLIEGVMERSELRKAIQDGLI